MIKLGNIYGKLYHGGLSGEVWSPEGISPTLTANSGGGQTPMVVVKSCNTSRKLCESDRINSPKSAEREFITLKEFHQL